MTKIIVGVEEEDNTEVGGLPEDLNPKQKLGHSRPIPEGCKNYIKISRNLCALKLGYDVTHAGGIQKKTNACNYLRNNSRTSEELFKTLSRN
jgi:hypothetical protein